MLSLGLTVAFGAMLSFAASDFFAKSSSAKLGSKRTTLIMLSTSFIVLILVAFFFGLTKINLPVLFFSVLSGLVYAFGYLFLYKSLETEQVSNTISLTGIEYGLVTVISVLVIGEIVTKIEILSFFSIFIGAFLVTTTKGFKLNKGYIPAILAMVAFSITYILLVFAQQHSGGVFTPLIFNRIVSVSLIAVYTKVSPEKSARFKRIKIREAGYVTLLKSMSVGVFNALASILYLFLAPLGFIAV